MTTELDNSVEYSVLVQAFKQAQTDLAQAHTKKKEAKVTRQKAEKEALAKPDFKILVWQFKRAKHRFKARKAYLKIVQARLKSWIKLNASDVPTEALFDLGIGASKKSDDKKSTEKVKVGKKETKVTTTNVKTVQQTTKSADVSKISPHPTQDLTLIEGIGPKVYQILTAHSITSFSDLAQTTGEALRLILKAHRITILDPTTWPEQAQLVVDNKLEELKALQLILKNGKRIQ